MSTKRRSVNWMPVVIGATAMLLLVPALATAQRGGRPGRQGAHQEWKAPRERMAERLNLTEDQQRKFQELRLDHRREAIVHHGKMAELRSRLQAEFLADTVDEGTVKSLNAEISKLRTTMSEKRLEHRLAMMNVLTPEQRKEMQLMGPGGRGMGRPMMNRPGGGGRHGGRGMRGDAGACPNGGPGLMGGGFGMGPGDGPWWMEDDELPPPPPAPGEEEGDL